MKPVTKLTIGFAAVLLGLGASLFKVGEVQGVKAANEVIETIDFTSKSSGKSNYTIAWDYGDNATIRGGSNSSKTWAYVKFGGKPTDSSLINPNYVQHKGAIANSVSRVSVVILSGSLSKAGMGVTSWGLEVYSDSGFSTRVDSVVGGTITNGAATFDFFPSSAISWAGNLYYRVAWTITNTSSTAGVVVCESVKFYSYSDAASSSLRYGTIFLDKTSAGCAAGNVPSDVWTELSDIYAAADADIQTAIKAGTGDNDLGEALERYDIIQAKYGYTDFLSRNSGGSSSFTQGLDNGGMTLVFVISSLIILAGSVVLTLVLSSRKSR